MRSKTAIYLDANAGAPLHPRVKAALFAFLGSESSAVDGAADHCTLDSLVNPSSTHSLGRKTQTFIHRAAEQVAKSFGQTVRGDQILWNSCGTEANQQVIRSVLAQATRPHWITTAIEHSATRHMVDWWKAQGGEVSIIPVDRHGVMDLLAFEDSFRADTALVSLIWANNETGVLQPIEEAIRITRQKGKDIQVHLDGAQVWGKLPLHRSEGLTAVGADFVTFAGHKIGAPSGCGVTYLRSPQSFRQELVIGNQQRGKRGGTENVLGMILTGVAAEAVTELFTEENAVRIERARHDFEAKLLSEVKGAVIHGSEAPRLCNTTNVGLTGLQGMPLVPVLDLDGICVSAGSACSSGIPKPSPILTAMGVSETVALSTIRVSTLPAHFEKEQGEDLAVLLSHLVRLTSQRSSRAG